MADNPRRGWWQFSLASIFWLMLCIAIGIGAYRWGYDAGFADQAHQRRFVGMTQARVYSVADLLPTKPTATGINADGDAFLRDLQARVLPNTWTENAGDADAQFFVTNLSIVVAHDDDGHDRILKYIKHLRSQKNAKLAANP